MAFTDNFDGEASEIDLISHTPSGGGTWTKGFGSEAACKVGTYNTLKSHAASSGNVVYLCTDQGSADQYMQFKAVDLAFSSFFICRNVSGTASGILVRIQSNGTVSLQKNSPLTQLGTWAGVVAGDIVRLECQGDNLTVKVNGTTRISVSDALNNTATRQGVWSRSEAAGQLEQIGDDFEAGVLDAAAPSDVIPRRSMKIWTYR